VNPLRDDTERLIGHIISFSDVTVLRQATINDERLRLAGDLHDSIGHSLNTITMNLEYVLGQPALSPEVARMVRVSYERSQSALVDLRRIVDELKPLDLEKVGLLRSLEALFGRFHQLPVSIRFTCEAVDDALIRRLKAGEAIYYICMEAVHNAIRHGRARSIDVMLAHRAGQLLLFISDDGSGSDPVSEGNGLSNMRRRVQALGGTFEYGSIYDGGFNIMINLPASPVSERK
jgi:signal transduction histidine kinase